jgi:hypothetical protein
MNDLFWEENNRLHIAGMQEKAKQAKLAKQAKQDQYGLRNLVGNTLIAVGEKIAGKPKPSYMLQTTNYK